MNPYEFILIQSKPGIYKSTHRGKLNCMENSRGNFFSISPEMKLQQNTPAIIKKFLT